MAVNCVCATQYSVGRLFCVFTILLLGTPRARAKVTAGSPQVDCCLSVARTPPTSTISCG